MGVIHKALRVLPFEIACADNSTTPDLAAKTLGFGTSLSEPAGVDPTGVRSVGDRKGIEEQTKTWDKTIVDRRRDLAEWVEALRKLVARGIKAFAFANN